MVITKTPFRISFFGGGTDYPVWYRKYGGSVISTTINKYCYLSCRYLPPFFEHKYRVVWSKIELVKHVHKIEHNSVREIIKYLNFDTGIEVHHQGDLPARSGLGSSSAFTVGLLNGLYALKGFVTTKNELAKEAIKIEQLVLKENVGSQDQIAAAYGGFNKIEFSRDGNFLVRPLTIRADRVIELSDQVLLFYSGIQRTASNVAAHQIKETPKKFDQLYKMGEMVDEAVKILNSKDSINSFGKLLHESWILKRSLTDKISNQRIDEIYEEAVLAGALGGKVLGAGGGGFILILAPKRKHGSIRKRLSKLLEVPIRFENAGSCVVFHQN